MAEVKDKTMCPTFRIRIPVAWEAGMCTWYVTKGAMCPDMIEFDARLSTYL